MFANLRHKYIERTMRSAGERQLPEVSYYPAAIFKATIVTIGFVFSPIHVSAQTEAKLSAAQPVDALSAALEQLGNADITAYYSANNFAPIWAQDNPSRLLALVTALETSEQHGLPISTYDISGLKQAWADADTPATKALLEIKATELYIEFATDLNSGLLEPSSVMAEIVLPPRRPSVSELLVAAAANAGNASLFESLEPSDPSYNLLQAELARLVAVVEAGGWGPKIPDGRTIRPGQSGERVLAIRQRLNALGYEGTEGESSAYDDDLVLAMRAFQTDKALDADGIIGPRTLLALNTDPTEQMKQVIVNLERRRWLNYDLGDRHIFVNQAAFLGYVMDFGVPTLVTRVVVGKAGSKYRTPEFIDEMTHMMVNPSWNVPQSIASQEYLPQLLRDPSVLARQNISMRVRGSGQRVDARLLDLSQYSENNFPFNLQQAPGPSNALGKVKFMFPNRFNIYLHDTPAKSLFNRDTRAYSHGCVRVQRPFDLAYTLLEPQTDDPQGLFQSTLRNPRETRIDLAQPVPIYLTYQTVFIDEDGQLAYRVDVYGRDSVVFDALAAEGVTISGAQG